MKNFEIITLFPQLFPGTLGVSVFQKSQNKLWNYKTHDLRDFGIGEHKQVDDKPFSGIPGMLIKPNVIENAMNHINFSSAGRKIFVSPRGKTFNQKMAEQMANSPEPILFLSGRYEGVDQRAIDYYEFEEISIGNYILAGGDVAIMVMMEAIVRKIPGVLSNQNSFNHETFSNNEISEPRYTRPFEWQLKNGKIIKVNELLISGNHEKIKHFQKLQRQCIVENEE